VRLCCSCFFCGFSTLLPCFPANFYFPCLSSYHDQLAPTLFIPRFTAFFLSLFFVSIAFSHAVRCLCRGDSVSAKYAFCKHHVVWQGRVAL
jgi:hypothetical protein